MSALPPRQKIIPCLWFDRQAEEAASFYGSLLPDSRIDAVVDAPGDYPSGKAGEVLVVGRRVGSAATGPGAPESPPLRDAATAMRGKRRR